MYAVSIGATLISLAVVAAVRLLWWAGLAHKKNPRLKVTEGFCTATAALGFCVAITWNPLVRCITHIHHPITVLIWFIWFAICVAVFTGTLSLRKGYRHGADELRRPHSTFLL